MLVFNVSQHGEPLRCCEVTFVAFEQILLLHEGEQEVELGVNGLHVLLHQGLGGRGVFTEAAGRIRLLLVLGLAWQRRVLFLKY